MLIARVLASTGSPRQDVAHRTAPRRRARGYHVANIIIRRHQESRYLLPAASGRRVQYRNHRSTGVLNSVQPARCHLHATVNRRSQRLTRCARAGHLHLRDFYRHCGHPSPSCCSGHSHGVSSRCGILRFGFLPAGTISCHGVLRLPARSACVVSRSGRPDILRRVSGASLIYAGRWLKS